MDTLRNIFERLRLGESVSFFDPDYHLINEACARTREVMHRVNREHDTTIIRGLLNTVFRQEIPTTSVIIPPFHLNYGEIRSWANTSLSTTIVRYSIFVAT